MPNDQLTLAPEIEELRALLRLIGSDNPEERQHAAAEIAGMSRVISVLVRAVQVEMQLRQGAPTDQAAGFQALIGHVLDQIAAEGHGTDPAPPPVRARPRGRRKP